MVNSLLLSTMMSQEQQFVPQDREDFAIYILKSAFFGFSTSRIDKFLTISKGKIVIREDRDLSKEPYF